MIHLSPPLARLVVTPHGAYGVPRRRRAGTHHGLDFEAQTGDPVMAAAPGVVDRQGYDRPVAQGGGGGGTFVVLRHAGGFETAYMHLADVALSDGTAVAAGDVIGHAGSSGTAVSGAHLHFELRQYVGGKRVRLDPSEALGLRSPSSPSSPSAGPGGVAVAGLALWWLSSLFGGRG